MMNLHKIFTARFTVSILLAGFFNCNAQAGPAEKTGQHIDKAAEKAAIEIKKFAGKAGKAVETAGEKIQDTAKKAQKK